MKTLKITRSFTNRSSTMEYYLSEVSRFEVLTPDEEHALAIKVRDGDLAAMEKLIQSNLRFVISVAKKYQNLGLSLDDVIMEGNLGLIKAAERFDPSKGFKFISFAVWWVRQSIIAALQEKRRMVRLPGNQVMGISKVTQAVNELEQRLEREPDVCEIAEHTGMEEERVRDFLFNSQLSVSLDREAFGDNGGTMMDILSDKNSVLPDTSINQASVAYGIRQLLLQVDEREARILCLFYGLEGDFPRTLDDIAELMNLSKERVRQLKQKSLKQLRKVAGGELVDLL